MIDRHPPAPWLLWHAVAGKNTDEPVYELMVKHARMEGRSLSNADTGFAHGFEEAIHLAMEHPQVFQDVAKALCRTARRNAATHDPSDWWRAWLYGFVLDAKALGVTE